jgi:hypothetical protein
MTLAPPLWAGAATYVADTDRELINSVFRSTGVVDLPGGHLKVSQRAAGANMSVDVAAGTGIIEGTDAAGQGRFLCASDAVVNKVVNAAPGAGTSRIDRIYARVFDADVLGGTSSWEIGYIAGTAAASPTAPALPTSSIPLAQFTVLNTTTSITSAMCVDQRTEAAVGRGPEVRQVEDNNNVLFTNTSFFAATGSLTLPAGNWLIEGDVETSASIASGVVHVARIWNTTDGAALITRSVPVRPATSSNGAQITVRKAVSLLAQKVYVLQAGTNATGGTQLKTSGILIATRIGQLL